MKFMLVLKKNFNIVFDIDLNEINTSRFLIDKESLYNFTLRYPLMRENMSKMMKNQHNREN